MAQALTGRPLRPFRPPADQEPAAAGRAFREAAAVGMVGPENIECALVGDTTAHVFGPCARGRTSYYSRMPDKHVRTPTMCAIGRAANWRPQTNRQKWHVVLTVAIMACAAAVAIPTPLIRTALLHFAGSSILIGWLATESRRSRREREALAVRLAALPPGDVPADVVSLVASGKKIRAVKRYRQVTGTSLSQAKAYIDGL
jgi:hypothetical protein